MGLSLFYLEVFMEKSRNIENQRMNLKKLTLMALFIAIGVVISPILRVQGFCPTQHFINVVCAVFLGPIYAFVCAICIGIIRMTIMGIPPLALTGAIFGAFLSGYLYQKFDNKIIYAVLGEIIGTGIIGSIISYPVMKFIMGNGKVTLFFYTPSFIIATIIGGSLAFVFLTALKKNKTLEKLKGKLNE